MTANEIATQCALQRKYSLHNQRVQRRFLYWFARGLLTAAGILAIYIGARWIG